MTDAVLLEMDGAIARIILNRPKSLNALNADLTNGLVDAVDRVADDDNIRCVVLMSSSDHFMAGGDLLMFKSWLDEGRDVMARKLGETFSGAHGVIRKLRSMAKPVLASVPGAAAGFGLSLMAACDLVVAAENASFTLAYVRIGASPDGGSTHSLPRLVGVKRAMEIALLGEAFDAQKAQEIGLINRVVPAADLKTETDRLASRLANGPTQAMAGAKLLINQSMETDLERQLKAEETQFLRYQGLL